MNNFKKISLATISLSIALVLGGCSSKADGDELANTETEIEIPTEEESTIEERDDLMSNAEEKGLENITLELTLDDVLDLFYEKFGSDQINIESIELERDNGQYVYEIEGWDAQYEYELEINAETSEIIELSQEKEQDEDEILDLKSVISPQEAMEAALKASGSGYVDEWELEMDNNQMIYEIDIKDGHDQKINALTGEVL